MSLRFQGLHMNGILEHVFFFNLAFFMQHNYLEIQPFIPLYC